MARDNHQANNNVTTSNSSPGTRQSTNVIKRKRDMAHLDKSQSNAKKASITDNETANKYFLLSLLPEMTSLNDDQLREFKIKALLLIENIKKSSRPS